MYVCICNAVTDREIRKARDKGASTLEDLSRELKVATCCGRCADCAKNILNEKCQNDKDCQTGVEVDIPLDGLMTA